MISIESLAYSYDGRKKMAFPDFGLKQGDHLLLLGESGSGKTTLLHLLGGLLRSHQGKVSINETDISALTESELDTFRGRHIGFVFQRNHLVSALTVSENLSLAPFLAGLRHEEQRLNEVATNLGLSDVLSENVKRLSQGQAQRVAIARAVLNKPAIILADEPTSSLDDKNCERVTRLLLDVSRQNNSTLIVATHDQRLTSVFQTKYVLA